MKKTFAEPVIEVIRFSVQDVVMCSSSDTGIDISSVRDNVSAMGIEDEVTDK